MFPGGKAERNGHNLKHGYQCNSPLTETFSTHPTRSKAATLKLEQSGK